jgi:gamma-glutamylcyclotransferase (GGCT)/AIG2-like uncharacterized protein YtfP
MMRSPEKIHIFTYGSLMIPAVMHSVTGCDFASVSASLWDYGRYRVKGEYYPGIVSEKGALIEGVLYLSVDPGSVKRLDAFEGDWYVRTPVKIRISAGQIVPGETYVFKEEHRHLLSSEGWDIKTFESKYLQTFTREYPGFRVTQRKG